jgi:hypothetical protein
MVRALNAVAAVLAVAVWGLTASASVPAMLPERALPMHFDLRQEAAETCAKTCRRWISATGVITADTPRDFLAFAEGKELRGTTIALDSDGGSVLGALALGRAVRALDMSTTVGRSIGQGQALDGKRLDGQKLKGHELKLARLDPHADCESMCAFVLLAGLHRHVPDEARVLVHQIWIGDRRDAPTAAIYSAEDLALVQRDIGRIAHYLADMGASPEILDLALRIPPWEPMRRLSRDELQRLRIVTADPPIDRPVRSPPANATVAMPATLDSAPPADGRRGWHLLDGIGGVALTRRHPLTVEGDEIGAFDVTFACGPRPGHYLVSYSEWRRPDGAFPGAAASASQVTIAIGRFSIALTTAPSSAPGSESESDLFASGVISDEAMQAFAGVSARSLTVATTGAGAPATSTRIGNTGFARSLPQLATRCEAKTAKRPTGSQAKPGTFVQAGDITRN